ncbi:tetratricopeptide repeat protein, partial [Streptomyces europaeiscabiei]|uniref:tetratricopeptide repeat protein n=1 Tax=Streptomyces europaeiscabiei TaxID=146819 RepID=UPI0038F5E87B
AETFRDLADCYAQSRNYQQAIKNYDKAIELDTDKTPQNYLQRAKAYDSLGKKDLAEKDRATAAKLSQTKKK